MFYFGIPFIRKEIKPHSLFFMIADVWTDFHDERDATIARRENSRERGCLVSARNDATQMIMMINVGKDKTSRTIFFLS